MPMARRMASSTRCWPNNSSSDTDAAAASSSAGPSGASPRSSPALSSCAVVPGCRLELESGFKSVGEAIEYTHDAVWARLLDRAGRARFLFGKSNRQDAIGPPCAYFFGLHRIGQADYALPAMLSMRRPHRQFFFAGDHFESGRFEAAGAQADLVSVPVVAHDRRFVPRRRHTPSAQDFVEKLIDIMLEIGKY